MKIQTKEAAMKSAIPKTELPPSTQLRKAVFGGSPISDVAVLLRAHVGRERLSRLFFAFTLACVLCVSTAQAALIAEWQFNTYSGGPISSAIQPEYGSQSATAGLTLPNPGSGAFAKITGTALNEFPTSSPTYAVQVKDNHTYLLTLHITGTGLSGFEVSYATEQSASAVQTWYYSTDGTSYTALSGGTVTVGSSWATETVNFSGVSALNGAANVYFQDRFTLAATGDTMAFDNIAITDLNAVPEPITYALALFGVCVVGVGAGRRVFAKTRL